MGKKQAALVIGAGLIIASGGIGGLFIPFAAQLASVTLAVGLSLVGMAFVKTPQDPDSADNAGQKLQTTKSNTSPVPFVYGENKLGGNIIWQSTNNYNGGTSNNDYWAVIAVAEGTIEDFMEMYFNEDLAADNGSYIFTNDYVHVIGYAGSSTGSRMEDLSFCTGLSGSTPVIASGETIFSSVSGDFTASTTEAEILDYESQGTINFYPTYAQDGDEASIWIPTTGADEWIKIMSSAVTAGTVDSIRVQVGGDGSIFNYNFELQYSDDDATWYSASNTMQSENRAETLYWISILGIVTTSHKYWRIYFNEIDSLVGYYLANTASVLLPNNQYTKTGGASEYASPIVDIDIQSSQRIGVTIPKDLAFLAVHQLYVSTDSAHVQLDNITSIIQGRKIREISAFNILSTSSYSSNPARIIIDVLIEGLNIDSSDIDIDSFFEAHNYCANRGITCNIVFNRQQSADAILRDVLATMRGFLSYSSSKWHLLADAPLSSVKTLTADDIINGTLSLGMKSNNEIANKISYKYINPADEWQSAKSTLLDTELETLDNQSVEQIIEARGITNALQAQDYAQLTLNQMRYSENSSLEIIKQTPLSISFTTTVKNAELEVGDMITISHDLLNYDRKFLILSSDTDQSGAISIKGREYCDTHYRNTTYYNNESGGVLEVDFLLLEDGFFLLQEDGTSKIIL